MTINLENIPHPRDCHKVPVGAVIPAGTPFWCMTTPDCIAWYETGDRVDITVSPGGTFFTVEPITSPVPGPTIADSHIIARGVDIYGKPFSDVLMSNGGACPFWDGNDSEGEPIRVVADDITEWSPAVVTKTGLGIWDERDKRDRIDINGNIWCWLEGTETWECAAFTNVAFGSLHAFRGLLGERFLTGFTDDREGGTA